MNQLERIIQEEAKEMNIKPKILKKRKKKKKTKKEEGIYHVW